MSHAELCPICKGSGRVPVGGECTSGTYTVGCRACAGLGYLVLDDTPSTENRPNAAHRVPRKGQAVTAKPKHAEIPPYFRHMTEPEIALCRRNPQALALAKELCPDLPKIENIRGEDGIPFFPIRPDRKKKP